MSYANRVALMGTYGGDLTHALSAWTSTSRELTEEKLGRVDALLNMLMGDEHHTVFEKSSIHFLVTTDIASHIHLLKHRIGVSINAESARYKELGHRVIKGNESGEDKFYLPNDWPGWARERLQEHCELSFRLYHQTLANLKNEGVDPKRAKESARFFLPYASQLTADVMFNFRSFMHFQILRNSEHAQHEIRQIAEEMWRQVDETGEFPISMAAFTEWRNAKTEFYDWYKNKK